MYRYAIHAVIHEEKMKTHHFKYVLLLALLLLGITSFLYSQESPKQTNGEDTTPKQMNGEDTTPKQMNSEDTTPKQTDDEETIAKQTNGEDSIAEQEPLDEPNPLESLNKRINDRFVSLEGKQSILEEKVDNPFQIILMIIGSIIILIIGVLFFFSKQEIRQLQFRFENSQRQWKDRSQENDQRWDGQLKLIRQQGKENTEKLESMMSNHTTLRNEQTNLQSTLSKVESRLDGLELALVNIGSDSVPDRSDGQQPQVYDQLQLEEIIQEAQTKVESLALAYESGESIDMISIENPTPSQNVVLILNLIARLMEEWENELKQSTTVDANLIQSLGYASQAIKDKLKEIRGPAPPVPTKPELDTDVANNEIQRECNAYVSRYEGMLTGLQLGRKFDETEYNQFIPQFIKDRLFNGVARFVQYDNIPEQLNEFLQLVGFEVVPIEIGKTKADSRFHEIQGSRKTDAESGSVVEVILPGLQRKDDGEIIQKPIIMRGE